MNPKPTSSFRRALSIGSRRPSGLRKTNPHYNSLAHRTTWLRSDLISERGIEVDKAKVDAIEVRGQAVFGRQIPTTTPWLTERHGYDPTFFKPFSMRDQYSSKSEAKRS